MNTHKRKWNFEKLVGTIREVHEEIAAQAGQAANISLTLPKKEEMQRYFDAHVYVANWMTDIFMVRLPIEVLPKETAEAYAIFANKKQFQKELKKFMAGAKF